MKILQQCIYFPPEVGGLESHAFYLCRDLVRLGHEVTMVTSQSKKHAPREEMMDGIRVVRRWFPSRNPAGWIKRRAFVCAPGGRTRRSAPSK